MIKFPESKWIYKWGIDQNNANDLYQHILNTKPTIIIETGTFEGQATYVMAKACNELNNNSKIYTIDYNGDPTLNLEEYKWIQLKNIRDKNLEQIKKEFNNVSVNIIEGDSREVLKTLFIDNNINKVDLFYQDSMHFIEGIQAEWNFVEPYIKQNSIVIFDDLKLKGVQAFKKWFIKKYNKQYTYKDVNIGHKQFIITKN